jgi:hypothetical protein
VNAAPGSTISLLPPSSRMTADVWPEMSPALMIVTGAPDWTKIPNLEP